MAMAGEGTAFTVLPTEGRGQWLAARKQGIGGSDVAAILGVSPWKGPLTLAREKRGALEEQEPSDTEALQLGSDLEPLVRERYRALHEPNGAKVRQVGTPTAPRILVAVGRPWAQATLDGEVHEPGLGWGVLEIKVARSAKSWDEGVPAHYLAQVAHYLSVTGRGWADVAALVASQWREERLLRDEIRVAGLTVDEVAAEVDRFWQENVLGGVDPEPNLADAKGSCAFRSHEPGPGKALIPEPVAREWEEAGTAKRAADARYKMATEAMKEAFGSCQEAANGPWTWKRAEGARFDSALLKAERPDVYQRYCTVKVRDLGVRAPR